MLCLIPSKPQLENHPKKPSSLRERARQSMQGRRRRRPTFLYRHLWLCKCMCVLHTRGYHQERRLKRTRPVGCKRPLFLHTKDSCFTLGCLPWRQTSFSRLARVWPSWWPKCRLFPPCPRWGGCWRWARQPLRWARGEIPPYSWLLESFARQTCETSCATLCRHECLKMRRNMVELTPTRSQNCYTKFGQHVIMYKYLAGSSC